MSTEVKLIEWFDSHWYKIQFEKEIAIELKLNEVEYFPSTTTKLGVIAKPYLERWRGDITNREADLRVFESQQRGVRIHNAWYTLTTAGIVLFQPHSNPNYTPGEIEAIRAEYGGNVAILNYQDEMYDVYKLRRWLNVVKPYVIASEKTVYSIIHKEAGTLDNLFLIEEGEYQINGRKPVKLESGYYVIDLKSGKGVDDDAYMQTADYAHMVEEMEVAEITGTLVLHTGSQVKTGIEGLSTLLRNKEQWHKDFEDYRHVAAIYERKHANTRPKIFEFPSALTLELERPKEKENV